MITLPTQVLGTHRWTPSYLRLFCKTRTASSWFDMVKPWSCKVIYEKHIKHFCGLNRSTKKIHLFQSHLNVFTSSTFLVTFNSSCLHRVSVSTARWKGTMHFNRLKLGSFRKSFCHLYSQPVATRSGEYIKKRSKSHWNKTKPAPQ